MTLVLLLLGLFFAVLLSGFFSGSETGVYCLNHVRLRVASARGDVAAQRVEQMARNPEDLVITMLMGTNVADYLATAFAAALFLHLTVPANLAELYATALVTPLIFVFGGIVPKDWFRREANRLMMFLSTPILVARALARATGLVALLRGLTHGLLRWVDPSQRERQGSFLPRARTLWLLREGAARGGLTAFQRDLIERVLNLSEVRCVDVMVPRQRAALVPHDMPREDFLRVARMAHFSRLPVYRKSERKIVGVVSVYDVLNDDGERPIEELMRKPLMLPPNTPVGIALQRLQQARETMAIVETPGGECVGLLTLKDLVEEIVGELGAW
jgi:putative hemolysin